MPAGRGSQRGSRSASTTNGTTQASWTSVVSNNRGSPSRRGRRGAGPAAAPAGQRGNARSRNAAGSSGQRRGSGSSKGGAADRSRGGRRRYHGGGGEHNEGWRGRGGSNARSRGGRGSPSKAGPAYAESVRNTKIFVGGLSWDTTEDGLREYFGQYGEVADTVVMRTRHTLKPRGFGFVIFRNPISAEIVGHQHSVDGKRVEVKMAVPKEAMSRGSGSPSSTPPSSPSIAAAPQPAAAAKRSREPGWAKPNSDSTSGPPPSPVTRGSQGPAAVAAPPASYRAAAASGPATPGARSFKDVAAGAAQPRRRRGSSASDRPDGAVSITATPTAQAAPSISRPYSAALMGTSAAPAAASPAPAPAPAAAEAVAAASPTHQPRARVSPLGPTAQPAPGSGRMPRSPPLAPNRHRTASGGSLGSIGSIGSGGARSSPPVNQLAQGLGIAGQRSPVSHPQAPPMGYVGHPQHPQHPQHGGIAATGSPLARPRSGASTGSPASMHTSPGSGALAPQPAPSARAPMPLNTYGGGQVFGNFQPGGFAGYGHHPGGAGPPVHGGPGYMMSPVALPPMFPGATAPAVRSAGGIGPPGFAAAASAPPTPPLHPSPAVSGMVAASAPLFPQAPAPAAPPQETAPAATFSLFGNDSGAAQPQHAGASRVPLYARSGWGSDSDTGAGAPAAAASSSGVSSLMSPIQAPRRGSAGSTHAVW